MLTLFIVERVVEIVENRQTSDFGFGTYRNVF